ncbi:MAG: response regulator [Selenomonadaceae bacterium]|nr:response regulator [Selenomonadaceae bacterium]
MKQVTYRLESRESFLKFIYEIKYSKDYQNAREVLFKVLTSQILTADVYDLSCLMKEYFPNDKLVGISMSGFAAKKSADSDSIKWHERMKFFQKDYAVISCLFFESTDLKIFEIAGAEVDNFMAMTANLNRELKKIPNLKGVEILFAGGKERVAIFMDRVTEGLEDIPFFGAEAGAVDSSQKIADRRPQAIQSLGGQNIIQYVMGRRIHNEGIIVIAYSGEDLHITTEYNFGWKPVGMEMTVTETLGINGLCTIDGAPAIEIYRKYLNVEPNEFLLFNVFDFPFVVDRGGLPASRVAAFYDEEGRLYMTGDVRKGEKIRLSYGNPEEILQETWESSERMRQFKPQAIFAYICGARTIFLDVDASREMKDFLRIVPHSAYCFGGGEIYKHHGMGGQLATALLAIGFREGKDCACYSIWKRQAERVNKSPTLPLARRLAAFLAATTNDLKEINRNYRAAAEAAEAANKSKSQFLSNMSHEIRTPINAILGMNEMILRESSDPQILEYAENIRAAGNTLLGIVNDILDFSKIEAGKMEIIPVEYALSSLLNDLVNMIQARAEKKGLEFHINAEWSLPSDLYGDEIRIKQIVTNILTNAVKYTEKGSVTLTVSSRKIADDTARIRISVKDTGIGIKQEDLKKLYSAFERIEEKRNRTIEGTGLGMNITKSLLEMMGSRLEVSSVYGEGSDFSFEIEQKVLNWHPIGDFEESYRHALSQHKKYREKFTAPAARILVVDDTVMNITVVKGLLKQTKIKIDTADSGYAALKLVTKNVYDIIFLDHRMPGIDGIETLQRMKAMPDNLNQSAPVISLTANAISGARQIYINAGFQDYLTKPIDSEKLEAMLLDYLPAEKVHSVEETDDVEIADEKTLPEWLKNVVGINTADGLRNCGDVDSYLDALTVFAQSVTSGAKEISNFYHAADWKNYTTKVHALKSSARVIGANELSDRARRLEDAGNSGYINEINDFTDELLELYISFANKLAPLVQPEEDDSDKPLIDDDALAEAYEALNEAAAGFDYDTAMFVLDSLADYRIPENQREKFSQIKSAAAKPDWETLANLLVG